MATVELRGYQRRILEATLQSNTIVLLPTGAGKTFIAAETILRIGAPAVFFVPTIPLVEQQAQALRSRPGMPLVGEFHGEKALPEGFSVLVTTPKAFETAQGRGISTLAWECFNVVVFDEIHHTLKDHPYRNLALRLRASSHRPRVIGLTASLTYAVGAQKIKKSVRRLCDELRIEQIEHAAVGELISDGYHGSAGRVTEVLLPEVSVKPGIVEPRNRQPHLMHSIFFNRVDHRTATPFALALVGIINRIEGDIQRHFPTFESPLEQANLKSWGEYANRMARECDNNPSILSIENWYEALRILVVSWEEADDACIAFLRMTGCDRDAPSLWARDIAEEVSVFFLEAPSPYPRFEHLYNTLLEKLLDHPDFRGILFVRQRITTHIIQYLLREHPRLRQLLNTVILYSSNASATPSFSLSRKQTNESLRSFATGEANLLIASAVAEEGMDIPAANCVIYFDHIDHAVSFVQGRGRARQAESSFVVLNERADRPVSLLVEQEVEQHRLAASFVPNNCEEDTVASRHSQRQRELGAQRYLCDPNQSNALANINIFCKKTKTVLSEHMIGPNTCTMTYKSLLRTVSVQGEGNGKKAARKAAAINMLDSIAADMNENP